MVQVNVRTPNGRKKWKLFYDSQENLIRLFPYDYEKRNTPDALATLEALHKNDNLVDVIWRPESRDMNSFDNIIKWKADYTKKWFDELIELLN